MNIIFLPLYVYSTLTTSLVVCGLSLVSDFTSDYILLKKVDLPLLGFPIIATFIYKFFLLLS